MSQENVKSLYQANDAFNRGDINALLQLAHPDIELTTRIGELEGGGSYRGHDGVRRWWENLFAVFPDFTGELEEVRDSGDMTVARVRARGDSKGDAPPMEQTQWHVNEWRHGKAISWRVVLTEAEALEAAGLSE